MVCINSKYRSRHDISCYTYVIDAKHYNDVDDDDDDGGYDDKTLTMMMISIVDSQKSSYVNDDLWIFSQCGCWDVVETNRSGSPDRAVTVMRRSSSSEEG